MNSKLDLPWVKRGVIDFCFCTLLFSYPILSFLWRRSYPIFTLEVLWLFSIVVGVSLVLSFLLSRVGPAISYALTATLILLSFLVQFNLTLVGIGVCLLATATMMLMSRQNFRSYCLPVLLALFLGAYLDSKLESDSGRSMDNVAKVDTELAPVVHVLLDGFIGVAGLPNYPASELIGNEILSFFRANEFVLFSHAYSRYFRTGESVYASMNYRHDFGSDFFIEEAMRSEHVMTGNALFSTVEDLGYRLNVYQTSHIDLCQSNPQNLDRCWQYSSPNVLSALESNDVNLRFLILARTLLQQSRLLLDQVAQFKWFARVGVAVHDPRLFEVLGEDVQDRAPGNYFFAHALIPHGPYVYQSDCSINYAMHPVYTAARTKDEQVLPDEVYEIRNGLYFGHVDCALKNLQSLIDIMKGNGTYDRAIIILHGDHGSRITPYNLSVENRQHLQNADYRAAFSTLFAVKYPGSKFSVNDRVLPISYLLEEFLFSLPSYVNTADQYPVFIPSLEASAEKLDIYVTW